MPVYNALPAFLGDSSGSSSTQTKIIQASTSEIIVFPDDGYLIDRVVVQPTPTETKTATPSTSAQTITPTTGRYLSSVTINPIQTQSLSVTLSGTQQTISPTNGYFFSQVTVPAAIPTIEHLHYSAGRNGNVEYQFSKAYKKVIMTAGGYGACSITTGSGWTTTWTKYNQANNSDNIQNTVYYWVKNNVAKNETVKVSLGDRYGFNIIGIN